MADTLSERLRTITAWFIVFDAKSFEAKRVLEEAAAELDRTEARLTALEQALTFIEANSGDPVMENCARAALKG